MPQVRPINRPSPAQKPVLQLSIRQGRITGALRCPADAPLRICVLVDNEQALEQCLPPAHTARNILRIDLPLSTQALDGFTHAIDIVMESGAKRSMQSLRYAHGQIVGQLRALPTLAPQGLPKLAGWLGFRELESLTRPLPVLEAWHCGQAVARTVLHACKTPHTTDELFARCARFEISVPERLNADELEWRCAGEVIPMGTQAFAPRWVGHIEQVSPENIQGWALDASNLKTNRSIDLLIDGRLHQRIKPHLFMPEVAKTLQLEPHQLGPVGFRLPTPAVLRDGNTHTLLLVNPDTGLSIGHAVQYRSPSTGWSLDAARQAWQLPATTPDTPRATRTRTPLPSHTADGRNPLVSVIILNRDGADCLDQLLASWSRWNTVAAELIVIDHASQDHSEDVVRKWASTLPIRWVGLPSNDSFSASCNRGAQLARGAKLLFLNNDIVLLQDILPEMLRALESTKVSAVGIKLLCKESPSIQTHSDTGTESFASARVQHLGVRFTLVGHAYWPYEATEHTPGAESLYAAQPVPAVTGAVMLMRRTDFKKCGGFDERYFYGYEDVELCLRLQHNTGRKPICLNHIAALHRHGHTRLSGRKPEVTRRLVDNQTLLASQMGLWVKRSYWQALVQARQGLSLDTLGIGLAVDDGLATAEDKAQWLAFAHLLREQHPHARIRVLPASQGWRDLGDLHVLVACTPHILHTPLPGLRADAVLLAAPSTTDMPQWHQADLSKVAVCLLPMQAKASAWNNQAGLPVHRITAAQPLPPLLQGCLRVSVQLPSLHPLSPPAARDVSAQLLGQAWTLKACANTHDLLVTLERPVDEHRRRLCVAEVQVQMCHLQAKQPVALNPDVLPDALHVAWLSGDLSCLQAQDLKPFDEVWTENPTARRLHGVRVRRVRPEKASLGKALKALATTVEERIGRTFCAS